MAVSTAPRARLFSPVWNLSARVAALGTLAIGFWFVYTMVRFQRAYFVPYAVADIWLPLNHILTAPHWPPSWSFYWTPHGDHRIPLPKLLIVLDLLIDRASGVFLLVLSYLTQFAHACLIGLMVRTLAPETKRSWLWIACLGGSLMALFHVVNWDNLMHPFQVCLLLGYCLATLGISWAVRAQSSVVVAIVSGVLAPFCFLSALAMWPVMFAAAVAVGRKWKTLAALAISGAALYILYFTGYHRISPPVALPSLARQPHIAFFFGLIGKPAFPFVIFGPTGLGGAAGEIGLVIFFGAAALLALPLFPALRNPMRIWTAANIAFALGSLLMISVGRWNQGYAWRYMTPAVLLWIFLIAGIGYELSRFKLDAVFSGLLFLFCLFASTRLVFQNRIRWDVAGSAVARARLAAAANAVGVEEPTVQVSIDSFGEVMRQIAGPLHDRRLMFYRFAPYDKVGTTFPRPSRVCLGIIEGVRPLVSPNHPGFEIAGVSRRQPADFDVYVLDRDNRIVGVAARRDDAPPEKWFAFLPPSAASSIVAPVEVPRDGDGDGPCLVAEPFQIEGSPWNYPIFHDADRASWIPVGLSESGEMKLPHSLSLDASSARGQFTSVILHLKLSRPNFIYLSIPGKPAQFAYVPLANQWVYVVFHINRNEEGVAETPLFSSGIVMLSYWPVQPAEGAVDGAWITRDAPPASDLDNLIYLDGSRQSK